MLGEREVPSLTPVHLQVFARQALETHRHVGDGLLVQPAQTFTSHRRPPHRTTAAVRMVDVLARQLHHAYAAESLLQPLRNLRAERIDARLPPPTGRLLIDGLTQRTSYRASAAAGMTLLAIGYSLFVAFKSDLSVFWVAVSGTLIGTGMGMTNLTTLVAVQNSLPHQRIGVATSTSMLFRTFGGAFAVSLMGTVLLNQMQRGLEQFSAGTLSTALRNKLVHPQNLLEPATRAQIPPELLPKLIAILGDAVWCAFLTGFALMIVGVAASFLMSKDTPAQAAKPL